MLALLANVPPDREGGSTNPENQHYPGLGSTNLDPGIHLLVLVFGLVVRPVFRLRMLHPGGEETLSPPNKGSVSPQTRLSQPVNRHLEHGDFTCLLCVHAGFVKKKKKNKRTRF